MRKNAAILAILSIGILTSSFREPQDQDRIRITHLTGNLYEIDHNPSFNLIHLASAGPDGILLVETGAAETALELLDKVRELGSGDLRYVINTHVHDDHVAGNAVFAPEAPIISHHNTKERFAGAFYHLPRIERMGSPTMTFEDSMMLDFNGEPVILKHMRSGHTDNDITVYFPDSDVLYIGDLVIHGRFSTVDRSLGGNVQGYLLNLEDLVNDYPDETHYVAAHGPAYSKEQIRTYLAALTTTKSGVEGALEAGLTADQILAEDFFATYADWARQRDWIEVLAEEKGIEKPPSICEPLSKTIIEAGADQAVTEYHRLKAASPEEYDFSERQLNSLGYALLDRQLIREAIVVFQLNAGVFPASANAYDSLGEAFVAAGDIERAISNYRKSLELDPSNENARWRLAELERR